MAALVISLQTNKTMVKAVDQVVAAANAVRVICALKNLGRGTIWVKLGGAATIGTDGWPIGPGGELAIGEGFAVSQGNGTNNYQGAINAIWDGDGSQAGEPAATGLLRVVELDTA